MDALASDGVNAGVVEWDDPRVDWAEHRLVVVRSTWDYATRRDEFLAWAGHVAAVTTLANPFDVLRWNTDKRYLDDLAAAGVPIVPTVWLEPGDAVTLPETGPVVVKPAVSAGAKDTARYEPDDLHRAREHVDALLGAGRTAMVQPYMTAVDERGETGILFAGGVFSHAVRKGPILHPGMAFVADLYAEEDISPREASADERDVAATALDSVPGGSDRLLYARVDLVPDERGMPVVLELEVTEPSLFLDAAPGSATRFAGAIAARLA